MQKVFFIAFLAASAAFLSCSTNNASGIDADNNIGGALCKVEPNYEELDPICKSEQF